MREEIVDVAETQGEPVVESQTAWLRMAGGREMVDEVVRHPPIVPRVASR
jgi:hypothetical protein